MRSRVRRRGAELLAAALLWRIDAVAAAPSTPAAPPYSVDTLVVEALRTPALLETVPFSVNQLPVADIVTREPALSLQEALTGVPGLLVAERHNLSQGDRIVIRGIGARASFGVRGVRVIADGIPLTMADGQSQLGVVDLSRLQRIDAVRGPAASLYGNAAGGVLLLQTRPPGDSRTDATFLVGSDGLRQWRAGTDLVGGGNWFHLGLSQTDLEGFRRHSYARERRLQARWRRQIDADRQLTLTAQLYDAPWLFNPSSLDRTGATDNPGGARFFARQQGAAKQVRHGQVGARLLWSVSSVTQIDLAAHAIRRTLTNPIPGRFIDVKRNAFGARIVARHRWRPAWESVVGLEVETQRDQRGEFANDGLADDDVDRFRDDAIFPRILTGRRRIDQTEGVTGLGLFTFTRWQVGDAWTLSAGARIDRQSFSVTDDLLGDGDDSGHRSLTEMSPTLGLTFTPGRRLTLFANVATAFLTPTTVELGNRADGKGGFNPDLAPEQYRSLEGGVRFLWPDLCLNGEATLYQLDLEEMLVPFQAGDSDETFYRNAAAARNRGAEARLSFHPGQRFSLETSLSVNDFIFIDDALQGGEGARMLDGYEVPGVPPVTATLGAHWQSTANTQWRLWVRHQGRMFTNDLNGPPPGSGASRRDFIDDAHTVVDLRWTWRCGVAFGQADLFLGIDNLFDTRYNGSIIPNAFGNRFFEPAPGRTFFSGLRLTR